MSNEIEESQLNDLIANEIANEELNNNKTANEANEAIKNNKTTPEYLHLKEKFNEEMLKYYGKQSLNDENVESIEFKRGISKFQMNFILNLLKEVKPTNLKVYNYRKKFKIQKIGDGSEYLIGSDDKKIVAMEDMFEVLNDIHISVGHQGIASMKPKANESYCNVTKPLIEIFLKYSEEYNLKRKMKNTTIVTKVSANLI